MVTEAILKFFIDAIKLIVNPILEALFSRIDLGVASFSVPSVLMDYAQYLGTSVSSVLPLMVAYWAWRQFKA